MLEYNNNETRDREIATLLKLPLCDLLYSAVNRTTIKQTVGFVYIDSDTLFKDSSIQSTLSSLEFSSSTISIALWISRWDDRIASEQVVETLQELKSKLHSINANFCFLLPDPYVLSNKAKLYGVSIETLLGTFQSIHHCQTQPIRAVESNFQLLKRIMSTGIKVNLEIDLSLLDDHLHVSTGPEMDLSDDLVFYRVCNAAIEIESELKGFSNQYLVQTTFPDELKQTLACPLAVPLLKALSLLRHIFPSTIPLTPSPNTLGKNLYLLFSELGICSILQGAFETTSAKMLKLPLLSEICDEI